jgi:opine dehydrogenase
MLQLVAAVVGSGNGSYTIAGDLALAGHAVRMSPGPRDRHPELYETRTIELTGLGRVGLAHLERVSEDLAEVVPGAQLIFSSDPAFTQVARARAMAPHLEDGQVVFLSPGSLGSYLFAKTIREAGSRAEVTCVEPGTLPYLTRKVAPGQVQVSGLAAHLPVGVFAARNSTDAVALVQSVFPAAHGVENALSVALLNVGPIIHSVLVLLNTGPIEHFPSWDIHNEGTTPAVKRLILAHDAERIALRRALGFTSHHYPFADHYQPAGDDEWMYGRKAHTDLVKSEKWREQLTFAHRYVTEDVKCNLALLASIGDLCGVETPIADSLLTLIGTITGEDYRRTGRTLEALGLGGRSVEALTRVLEQGFGG